MIKANKDKYANARDTEAHTPPTNKIGANRQNKTKKQTKQSRKDKSWRPKSLKGKQRNQSKGGKNLFKKRKGEPTFKNSGKIRAAQSISTKKSRKNK